MPPAVLFDLYDTLAWIDWRFIHAGRARLAELAGVDARCLMEQLDRTVATRSVGELGGPEEELAHLLAACGGRVEDGRLRALTEMDRDTWARGVRLYDDALPCLRRLRDAGCALAIVSNCTWQGRAVVQAAGLDREVETAVLSCEIGVAKPDPAPLRHALETLAAPAEAAVLVDDLADNLDAARLLGMRTLMVDRRDRGPNRHPRVASLEALERRLLA